MTGVHGNVVKETTITVAGPVRGKGRPRFSRASGRARTDHKTRIAESRIWHAWLEAGRPRLEGPLQLLVTVALPRPGSHWLRDRVTLSAAGKRSSWPTKTPDFDNVAKLIADALNGSAYTDDAAVVHHWFVKRWCSAGEPEHTEIVIRQMPPFPGSFAAPNALRAA